VQKNLEDIAGSDDRILITGSTGFIGAKVVETLLEYGFSKLRCFVRPSSRLERLENVLRRFDAGKNVELISGDLVSREDCQKAAKGVSIIYQLAAGIEKSFAGAFMNSALATRNLIDAFLELGQPRRFVNVSSFAVYSNLKLKHGALLDETCALEDAPQKRFDAYCFGKLKQEELVREYGDQHRVALRYHPTGSRVRAWQEGSEWPGMDQYLWVFHSSGWIQLPAADLRG